MTRESDMERRRASADVYPLHHAIPSARGLLCRAFATRTPVEAVDGFSEDEDVPPGSTQKSAGVVPASRGEKGVNRT